MWELLVAYWPHILAALSVTMATAAIVHVVMTKDDVRAATGWVGVVLLSPVLGALIYAVAGINRIRRASIASGVEDDRQNEAAAYYAELKASGNAPVPEKKPAR